MLPGMARRPLGRLLGKLSTLRYYAAFRRTPLAALRYLAFDGELDNFTYELGNEDELGRFMARSLSIRDEDAMTYIRELQADDVLRGLITRRLASARNRNPTMPYGRRLGWYVAARARKPRLTVETGVHDGLGSTVLLRAIERNAEEGIQGTLMSIDIRQDVGWLIPDQLRKYHDIRIGDSGDMLERSLEGRTVDFFVHDSDHAYQHETKEFELVLLRARQGTILISDNAHGSTAFRDFCARHDLKFELFREAPKDHFYPGAAIGLAIVTDATRFSPERDLESASAL